MKKAEIKEIVENEFYEWWMNVDLNFVIESVTELMIEDGEEVDDDICEEVGNVLEEVLNEFRSNDYSLVK